MKHIYLFALLFCTSHSARADYPPPETSPVYPETEPNDQAERAPEMNVQAEKERKPRALVLIYRVGGVDWSGDTRTNVISLNEDRISENLADAVARSMRSADRFEVRQVSAPRDWPIRADDTVITDGAMTDAEWIFDGRIDDIDIDTQYERTRKKHDNSHDRKGKHHRDDYDSYDESYTTKIRFTVHHRAQFPDGSVWRDLEVDRSLSTTSTTAPRASEISRLIEKSALGTVAGWTRMLVREKRGRVTARNGTHLILDLGRRDGVSTDVDFVFERAASGDVLRIAARPDAKHPGIFACIARPVRVEENWCEIEIGYNGSGGFFGPETKWKKRDLMANAVAPGDIAVLTPRAYGAK